MLGMASAKVMENVGVILPRAISSEKMAKVVAEVGASVGGDEEKVLECYGAHCFRLTFFIMMGVCLMGVILNIVLVYRTRRVYVMLYEKRVEARKASMEEIRRSKSVESMRRFGSGSSMASMSRDASVDNIRRLASIEDFRRVGSIEDVNRLEQQGPHK